MIVGNAGLIDDFFSESTIGSEGGRGGGGGGGGTETGGVDAVGFLMVSDVFS